jgi:alkylhydroperoxidase family enzyme
VRIEPYQSAPDQDAHGMQNPLVQVQGHAPEIMEVGMSFSAVTYAHSKLPLRVFEGARAITAELNGCALCQGFRAARDLPRLYGPDTHTVADNGPAPEDAFYAQVSNWRTSDLYDDRERLAIEYAERLGTDPKGVADDEDFWARARTRFSDAELIDLSWCIACWMGQGRVTHALGLDGVCGLGDVEAESSATPAVA